MEELLPLTDMPGPVAVGLRGLELTALSAIQERLEALGPLLPSQAHP